MQKRKSIHDIAKELNVAISTVSGVLNGKAEERRISEAMQKKVLEYAEKCGYQPNMIARSLRTGKSNIIGMLVEDISDPFFSTISRLVEKGAATHDYKIFYSSTENDPTKAKTLIRAFRDRQVDGYIIAPTPGIETDIQALMNDQMPLVLFDRYFEGLLTNNVTINNFNGAYNATNHLIENGFRNIAFITISSVQTQMMDRQKGYLAAIKDHQLEPQIKELPYTLSDDLLIVQIKDFLNLNKGLDAILFATNYIAVNGLKVIADLNLRIPEDLAVVGFDDNTHFNLFSPSITAVAQPIEKISQEILRVLLGKLLHKKNSTTESENIVLETELIIRKSSEKK